MQSNPEEPMRVLIICLLLLLGAASIRAGEPSAQFSTNRTVGGRIYIQVSLGRAVPEVFLTNTMFALQKSSTGQAVPIAKVSGAGAEELVNGVVNYKRVHLFGPSLDPREAYSLTIKFPDGSAAKTEIAPLDIAPAKSGSL